MNDLPIGPRHAAAFGLLTCVLGFGGCAGPETVPPVNEEATGRSAADRYWDKQDQADREAAQSGANQNGANGNVGTAGPSGPSGQQPSGDVGGAVARGSFEQQWQSFADGFGIELAGRLVDVPGRIAVFPAWIRTGATNRYQSCQIGDRMANRIENTIRKTTSDVLSGAALQEALLRANSGLGLIRDEASTEGLARRLMGTSFVQAIVTGTIDVRDAGRAFSGAKAITMRLQAKRLSSGVMIAQRELTIRDPRAAAAAVPELEVAGTWRIGERAAPFTPSVDREFDVLATQVLAGMLDKTPALFLDRRVVVQPLEMGATGGAARSLAARQKALAAAIAAAERRAEQGGATDPFQTAMDGPLTVGGKQFASGTDAVLAYEQSRAEVYGTRAGALAQDLSRSMGETIRALTGGRCTLIANDDRRQAVALVQADMLEYQLNDSIAADSIGQVQSRAADVVVRTSLRRRIEDYVMNVTVYDLSDPNRGSTETVTLPKWMVGPIQAATNR